MKSRVQDVLNTLSNRRVREEKLVEFKKQIVSNKSLKEYFKNNPMEKEVLQNDISKNSLKERDRMLFRHLDTLPFYAIPKELMATTPEQIALCTTGSGHYIPEWCKANNQAGQVGSAQTDKFLESLDGKFKMAYADAAEFQTSWLVQNLVNFPLQAQSYSELGKSIGGSNTHPDLAGGADATEQAFAYEHPTLINYEALEPTSGRKKWMIKHGKRIKKKLKADKRGYIGS